MLRVNLLSRKIDHERMIFIKINKYKRFKWYCTMIYSPIFPLLKLAGKSLPVHYSVFEERVQIDQIPYIMVDTETSLEAYSLHQQNN